jgi:hypothetical protein
LFFFIFSVFLYFFFLGLSFTRVCKSSELNWPMYSTHAIRIAKQREMKNLPVQEAKSKTVAKVCWIAKATFSPSLFLFFVRFSSGFAFLCFDCFSYSSCLPPCVCLFLVRLCILFLSVFGNGLLLGFFFLCRLGFLSNHPPFFLPPEICIYSARVPSLVRNQVSIKLILFFEVWILLRIKFESG